MSDINNGDSMQEMLGKLMSDPAIGQIVNQLKQSMASGDISGEAVSENESSAVSAVPASAPEPSVLGGLGGISPELINKLPELMGALGTFTGGGKNTSGISKKSGNMACLLSALKPYLSKHRCEAVDSIIAVSKLSSVMDLLPNTERKGDGRNV